MPKAEHTPVRVTKNTVVELDGETCHIVKDWKYWNDGSFNGKWGRVWSLVTERGSLMDERRTRTDILEMVDGMIEDGEAKIVGNGGFVDRAKGFDKKGCKIR